MVYLDNAATTSPKPQTVRQAISKAMEESVVNPGRSGTATAKAVAEQIFECRKKAAKLFGAKAPENVVFTLNCTHALNYVIKGALKKGDHVIVSSLEHNAVMRPIDKLKKDGFIDYDIAQVFPFDTDMTVRSFERLIRKNTTMIICTHASNVFGVINPIYEIGQLCKNRDIMFTVDCAQTAGVLPVDMEEFGITFLCCAGHKGLYGPMGTGLLITDGTGLKTVIEGGTGNNSHSFDQPEDLPERLESGTMNTAGILALSKGIDFVNKNTPAMIYNHEMRLIQTAYKLLKNNKKVMFYHTFPLKWQFVPVLSFNVSGVSSMQTAEFFSKNNIAVRAGYHCAPLAHKMFGTEAFGTVRISTSAFSVENDIKKLVYAVNKFTSLKNNY